MAGPGNGNHETMPARMGHEFRGIPGTLIHGIFTAHLDVSAERDGADAVIGVAAAEAQQALTESDGEHLDAHAKQLGCRIMAPFVNQDHESQNHCDSNNGR